VRLLGTPRDAAGEWTYYGCMLDGLEGMDSQRQNRVHHRFHDEKPEKFQSMAAGLWRSHPSDGGRGGAARPMLKKATSTIPMGSGTSPLRSGASCRRHPPIPAATPRVSNHLAELAARG